MEDLCTRTVFIYSYCLGLVVEIGQPHKNWNPDKGTDCHKYKNIEALLMETQEFIAEKCIYSWIARKMYLIRKANRARVNQPATQKYSIPIPTTVPHFPPT